MSNIESYPLKFNPIFKERIWGGTKLKTVLNKPIQAGQIGESWEISNVEGDISIVSNGLYSGKSLKNLINIDPEGILGSRVCERFGKEFPLLFKFLDAREDLSIQVHPNDELAKKRHNSFGKTEMWYVVQADENANIIVGFKKKSNPEEYVKNLENKTLLSILDTIEVKEGDVFFLETGTVHAIGAGMIIAEIQQSSDITYRLYDFDRKDANGNKRDLQIDLALEAINYSTTQTNKKYEKHKNKINSVVKCNYFTTNFIPLDGNIEIEKCGATFTVYMCVGGNFQINYNGAMIDCKKGDTFLIPSSLKQFSLTGKASILEIYI